MVKFLHAHWRLLGVVKSGDYLILRWGRWRDESTLEPVSNFIQHEIVSGTVTGSRVYRQTSEHGDSKAQMGPRSLVNGHTEYIKSIFLRTYAQFKFPPELTTFCTSSPLPSVSTSVKLTFRTLEIVLKFDAFTPDLQPLNFQRDD